MATSTHFTARELFSPRRNTDSSPSRCKESRRTTSARASPNSCLKSGAWEVGAITWNSLLLFKMRVMDSLRIRLQQRMRTLVGFSTAGPHGLLLVARWAPLESKLGRSQVCKAPLQPRCQPERLLPLIAPWLLYMAY